MKGNFWPHGTAVSNRGMLAKGYFTATYVSSVDDTEQPFALWIPRSYSRRKAYPLMVVLHGSDADHRMIPESCFEIQKNGFREDMILLSPFGRGDIDYAGPGETDIWAAMNWVRERYRVDARRQYLTGLSLGGYAAWQLACEYPEQWAAIAPVCGGGDVKAVSAMKSVPVWCVHGEKDDVVPVENARRMVDAHKLMGGKVRYDELRGWGHNVWDWIYDGDRKTDTLAEWFLQHRKAKTVETRVSPKRRGTFLDLFNERVIISYPANSPVPREVDMLRQQAEKLARFSWGENTMRTGRLIVKSDAELTAAEVASANIIALGRSDNHAWLQKAERKLVARHVKGQLQVSRKPYLGKSLLALTMQPSPWNKEKLLGVLTYQQFRQMKDIADFVLNRLSGLGAVNVYDTAEKKFLMTKSE
ncbi:MAG TPA: alpha/beta hydrolase-fold protein [Verrucomicrobiae bacterium]